MNGKGLAIPRQLLAAALVSSTHHSPLTAHNHSMIHSMTGYASSAREFPFGALSIELRSVNHRYLDIQFRLPDDLRAVEPGLRELLTENIGRGKVECRVSFTSVPGVHKTLKLN